MTRRKRSIVVSDHAVLRWLERSARIDIDRLRATIAGCADVGRALGARIVVVAGVKLVLSRDLDRVVTVLTVDQPHSDFVAPVEVDGAIAMVKRPKRRRRR